MHIRLLRSLFVFSVLICFIHLSIQPVPAQSGQAELTGEVRDQSGALIANAKISTTEVQSNQSYVTTTGSGGVYTLTGLRPGLYTVAVEATGFKRYLREGVQLTTGEKVRLDIPLEVGAVGETITIQSNAPPSESLKLPGIPSNAAFQNELPTFIIDGFQQLGPSANTDSDFRTDVSEIVDTLAFQRGRHSLKVGLDFRWERLDIIQPPSPTGSFRFSTLLTDLPGTTATGNPLASFLLGQVQTFSIDLQQKAIRPRAHIQEYFVQDDWKVAPRLTVNVGVRYTLNFPSTEVDNQGAIFNLQTQQFDFLGKDGFPRSGRELHKGDFGPRLGIAYRATDKTVVRSGYGLIWIEMAGITTPFINPQFPFIQTVSQRTLDNINPAFVLKGGPSVAPIPPTPDAGLGQGVFSTDRTLGSGYAQQWNLAVQQEITNNLYFEIAYAGSKITHVGIPDTNINQLTAEQLKMGTALLQRVPNPFFGQIPRSSSLGDPTIPVADSFNRKRTTIRERMNIEFRAEAFNLTNTPALGAPNVVLGTPGFGSITSAGDPRVIQLALKFNY